MNRTLCCALFIMLSLPLAAETTQTLEERQRAYTMSLYRAGNYFQCIDEIRKASFYWKADSAESEYFILCNYFSGGQYLTVSARLALTVPLYRATKIFADDNWSANADRDLLMLSQTCLNLGDYNKSAEAASMLGYSGIARQRYNIFARRIEPLLYLEDYAGALAELEIYKKMNDPYNGIAALEQELRSHKNVPHRSGALSVLFSALLPGAGQAYGGRYLDGALSLAGVGAAAAGGAWLHSRGERRLAQGAFFIAALFYAGNLYGAYNSAAEFNRRENNAYRDGIRANYFPAYEPTDYLNYGGAER